MENTFLPEEHTLHLTITNAGAVRLICTDHSLEALVVGYLYNEGLMGARSQLSGLWISPDHTQARVTLATAPSLPDGPVRPSGLGGEQLGLPQSLVPRAVKERYALCDILRFARAMDAQAVGYRKTGGMHCSALFRSGRQLALFEDIGRHNTLDKLAGHCLMQGLDTRDSLLITTGRISADMVSKAARLGACVIASYSAPTQAALDIATELKLTLLGYLNRERQQIYSVPERITLSEEEAPCTH